MHGPRVAVIVAHPVSGVLAAPVLGQRVLRVERKLVVVAAALAVQEAAQARKKPERLAQLRRRVGRAVAKLVEPANELIITQAARSLLHVWLQVVDRGGVLGVPLAGQRRQVANQRVAIAVYESRKLIGKRRIQGPIAGEVALIEQAHV